MEEDKKGDVLVNNPLHERKTGEEDAERIAEPTEESEFKNKRIRLAMYIGGAIAIVCFLLWLIVGRVEAYSYDKENDDLRSEMSAKDAAMNAMKKKNDMLAEMLRAAAFEVEGLTNKNAQLHTEVKIREELIDELKGKVGEKEAENDLLKKTIQGQAVIIEDQQHKIEGQADEIEDLNSEYEKLYIDMRMVVSITNQELNRNQALVKEIDTLEDKVAVLEHSIGTLTWKIYSLNEQIHEKTQENTLQWLSLTLLKKHFNLAVEIKSVYKGTRTNCDSKDFYEKIKLQKPNMFLATENSTGLVFGGFTSQDWTEGATPFKEDEYAFTFSGSNKAVCELTNSKEAINTQRERNGKKLMLTFGNFDITLANNCMADRLHEINVNQSYKCPHIGPKFFYTEEKNPYLSSFEFFEVHISNNH